ncbi:MAG: dihydrofolate reductase, partial [Clostridia bacterium]|nr:dihydrofolate reductase [Clostridia bacterium]
MKLIVAVDKLWGIGKNNGLLFDLKLDMKHFVEHTKGKVVVMGANTLKSLPNGMPLKNRTNIVLNPDGDIFDAIDKGYLLTTSLEELLGQMYAQKDTEVYVIGGAM